MATKCPQCGKKFKASQALCHDWKNPEQSFGCPHCGTFFVKDMKPSLGDSLTGGVIGGVLGIGIVAPAVRLFFKAYSSDDTDSLVASGTILVSLLLILAVVCYQALLLGKPLEQSPYKPPGSKNE